MHSRQFLELSILETLQQKSGFPEKTMLERSKNDEKENSTNISARSNRHQQL
jgi:hypothetical protein